MTDPDATDVHATPPQALAERWSLTPDGMPWRGFMSSVWPVRGPRGEAWAVKVSDAHHPPTREAAALGAWAAYPRSAQRIVRLVDTATDSPGIVEALLLERLDASRPLESEPDIERADAVLAAALDDLGGVAAPAVTPHTINEMERIATAIRDHRDDLGTANPLPDSAIDHALATLDDMCADDGLRRQDALCHFDLHYLNVLRDRDDSRWVVIDPLPHAGVREVEVVAALRNRWADTLVSGNPDRFLRRRLDRLCESATLDRSLARALAQAVAVDNLLWLLPRQPDSMFVPPYAVLATWME